MKVPKPLALFALGAMASGAIEHDLRRGTVSPSRAATSGLKTLDIELDLITSWRETGGYFMALDVGIPPQKIQVLVDTGSSDLWLPSASALHCRRGDCPGGSFDSSGSSTYSLRADAPPFDMEYADGTNAKGDYGTDVVRLRSLMLHNYTSGLANDLRHSSQIVPIRANDGSAKYSRGTGGKKWKERHGQA